MLLASTDRFETVRVSSELAGVRRCRAGDGFRAGVWRGGFGRLGWAWARGLFGRRGLGVGAGVVRSRGSTPDT